MEMICGSGNPNIGVALLLVLHSPATLFNAAPRSHRGPNETAGASRLDVFAFQRRYSADLRSQAAVRLSSCRLPALSKRSEL